MQSGAGVWGIEFVREPKEGKGGEGGTGLEDVVEEGDHGPLGAEAMPLPCALPASFLRATCPACDRSITMPVI